MPKHNDHSGSSFVIGILVGIIITLLVSCTPAISEGEVIHKWYEEETNNVMMVPITIGKITTMQSQMIHDDEDWCIEITGFNDAGERKTRKLELYAHVWTIVGDYVFIDGDSLSIGTRK